MDLDNKQRNRCLNDISKVSISYLTEQLDYIVRKNILLRLWTGCIDTAKAIRFNYVAGLRGTSNYISNNDRISSKLIQINSFLIVIASLVWAISLPCSSR